MRLDLTADSVTVDSDEHGYVLCVAGEDGDVITVNIQACVFDFYAAVQKEIRPYVLEAEMAKPGTLVDTPQHVLDAGVDAFLDTGYELDDPKHPTYHERMVD